MLLSERQHKLALGLQLTAGGALLDNHGSNTKQRVCDNF
jgi:hypothetical protein